MLDQLLDHLVGAAEYRKRDGKTKRLGGFGIDHQPHPDLTVVGRADRQLNCAVDGRTFIGKYRLSALPLAAAEIDWANQTM